MKKQELIQDLEMTQEFFERGISCFTEEHSAFAPVEGTFTVAQQVAHVAHTVDWFVDGAFDPNGFDLDFEGFLARNKTVTSLTQACQLFKASIENAISVISSKTEEDLGELITDREILTGKPKYLIPGAIAEHTAHHRGALTVYARLLGLVAPFLYKDMEEIPS